MKKLAGLTWWKNNYGSILQAYALQEKISEYSEVEYEIIQQFTVESRTIHNLIEYISEHGIISTMKYSFAKFGLKRIREREKVNQKFISDNLKISDRYYNQDNIYMANEIYDGFICGSDQVWNPKLTPLNSIYWLGFADDKKMKIAYAPSIGVQNIDNQRDKELIKKNLTSFNAISCREVEGTALINMILGANSCGCKHVLDPTMLVDREVWDNLIEKIPNDIEPYIFVYLLRGTKQNRKLIETIARKKGMKIITMPFLDAKFNITYDYFFGDQKVWSASPAEFINYIANASYVFTDSFHCTVFSCLYHREYYLFEKIGQAQQSRLNDLQQLLQIPNRLLSVCNIKNGLQEKNINWKQVDEIIIRERRLSEEYLELAIKG